MHLSIVRPRLLALSLLAAGLAGPALAQGGGQGGGQGNPSFNLINRSGQTIQEAYASSAQQNTWGQDLLGQDVLENGRSFAVRLPTGQCVNDIRVVYEGGRPEERRGVNTCQVSDVVFGANAGSRGGTDGKRGASAQPGRSGNPSFNLVNRTNKTIQVLRASPSSESSWGEDRLGNATVAPGGSFAIRLPAGECSYDVRVEYDNQSAEEVRSVDLCRLSDVAFPNRG